MTRWRLAWHGARPPMTDAPGKRRLLGRVLVAAGMLWLLIVLAAAVTGGWRLGAITVTSSRPLRFALMALFAGWFLLPAEDRPNLLSKRWLLSGLAAAVSWHLAYRVTRWLSMTTGAYDLSLFESTLHYTLEGRFMFAWGLNRSLFSEHLEPIVLLHLPVWMLFEHPLVLLVSQALAVGLAVIPLYRAARALELDAGIAALIGAAYLLNSVVWKANALDFHPELYAPLAIFWALNASLRRSWPSLYLATIFAFLIKEELALVMLCFSLLVLKGPGNRRWPHALAVALLSVAWAVFAFKWAMPASHPVGAPLHPLAGRWAHLGATYPEMAVGLLSRPGYLLGLLFSEPVAWVFGFVGGVPLLAPVAVVAALPPLLVHLTAQYGYAAQLGAYYGLFGEVLLLAGLVLAVERAHRRWGRKGALLASILAILPFPTFGFLEPPTRDDLAAAAFIDTIPPGETVCAQSPLAPRRKPSVDTLSMVPYCENPTWFLFARDSDRWPIESDAEYTAYVKQQLEAGYEPRFQQGEFLFLRRAP